MLRVVSCLLREAFLDKSARGKDTTTIHGRLCLDEHLLPRGDSTLLSSSTRCVSYIVYLMLNLISFKLYVYEDLFSYFLAGKVVITTILRNSNQGVRERKEAADDQSLKAYAYSFLLSLVDILWLLVSFPFTDCYYFCSG